MTSVVAKQHVAASAVASSPGDTPISQSQEDKL